MEISVGLHSNHDICRPPSNVDTRLLSLKTIHAIQIGGQLSII
jgi:hypothetical protein